LRWLRRDPMTKRFMSLFSGFGLADVGARQAGFELIAANEIDSKIASVYRENHGNHIVVDDVLNLNPNDFPSIDLLHISPPCTRFSINKRFGESELDVRLSYKVAEFIKTLCPQSITIENVFDYKKSKSIQTIYLSLNECGYNYKTEVLNAVFFGVPQLRKRLFIRAELKTKVQQIHLANDFRGWHSFVSDLLPQMKESSLPSWLLKRTPREILEFNYHRNNKRRFPNGFSADYDNETRAILIATGNNLAFERDNEPTNTIGSHSGYKAVLFDSHKIVDLDQRCLARFQTMPDDFVLPKDKVLATLGIGNGIPCLMYKKIAERSGACLL